MAKKTPIPLHNAYRPQKWADVIGQEQAVSTLSRMIKNKEAQCFLLVGESGIGKTTLARIAAKELGASELAIRAGEIDAATNTGVDAMRAIRDGSYWQSFDGNVKPIIIDEAHRLSSNAFDCLLKTLEEPPPHVFWFLCTTNATKIPQTIKTRSIVINLKLLNEKEMQRLLEDICEAESLAFDDDVSALLIEEARGSARQLLQNIATCRDCDDSDSVIERLRGAKASEPTIELCRFLAKGGTWQTAMSILDKMEPGSYEGTRIVIMHYFGKAAAAAKTEKSACAYLSILENFSTPFSQAEGIAPLMLAIGRTVFGES